MAYRNGTYVAFDGQEEVDPTKSDFKYYAAMQAWAAKSTHSFNFVNSHEKTYAVKDTSSQETLKSRIRERLSNSKNIMVLLSQETRKSGSMLSYEIELAVDNYGLPLIISYVDHIVVASPQNLSNYWPNSLATRLISGNAKAVHIPFQMNAIAAAIQNNDINNLPGGPFYTYSNDSHVKFGCLHPLGIFVNTKK